MGCVGIEGQGGGATERKQGGGASPARGKQGRTERQIILGSCGGDGAQRWRKGKAKRGPGHTSYLPQLQERGLWDVTKLSSGGGKTTRFEADAECSVLECTMQVMKSHWCM